MPSKFSSDNCTADYSQVDFEPNSDIAGPGVIVGFLGTAWLVIILVVAYYFFGFDLDSHQTYHHANTVNNSLENLVEQPVPLQADLQRQNNEAVALIPPNPVDKIILRHFHRLIQRCILVLEPSLPSKRSTWIPSKRQVTRSFRKCILAFCDVQIITGLGILASGYLSLGNLSAHHWKILVYLAWFSNVTHQAALMFLRGYLTRHPVERAFRIVFMVILYLLLLVAFIPTAFFNWESDIWTQYPELASEEIANSTNYPRPEIHYTYLYATAAYPSSPAQCFFDVGTGLKIYNGSFQHAVSECPMRREEFYHKLNTTVCSCQRIGDGVCNSNDTWWHYRQQYCLYWYFPCLGDTIYDRSHNYYGSSEFRVITFTDTTAFQSIVVSTIIMTLSFMIRLSKLYGTFSAFLQIRVRSFLSIIGKVAMYQVLCWKPLYRLLGARLWSLIIMKPLIALYILFRLFFDFYGSGISDIFWLTLSGTIGTINLIRARNPVKKDEEDSWTFGQILPVFLLVGPVLMTAQEFFNREDQKILPSRPCSIPSDISGYRQTETTNAIGEQQEHAQLSSAMITREHLNHLLLKDYYIGTKWMKFAVSLVVFIHFTILGQIAFLIVGSFTLNVMAIHLAAIILSVPALCYFLILVGLRVENRKYETAAMITCLLYFLGSLTLPFWLIYIVIGLKPDDVVLWYALVLFPGTLGYLFVYFFFGSVYVISSSLSRRVRSFISRGRQRRGDVVDREGLTTPSDESYNLSNMEYNPRMI